MEHEPKKLHENPQPLPAKDTDKILVAVLVAIGIQGIVLVWGQMSLGDKIVRLGNRQASISEVSSSSTLPSSLPVSSSPSLPSITSTTTSAGGSVILGEDATRRELLKNQEELKTSELAFLLGVTNDAITKQIKTTEEGKQWFLHGSEAYPVRKFQNTYKIRNPLLSSDPDN